MGLTERAFAPVQLTQKQAEELLRIADITRGRLTPRDMPAMTAEEFRARRRALNQPMAWDDYPEIERPE